MKGKDKQKIRGSGLEAHGWLAARPAEWLENKNSSVEIN